MSAFKSLFYSIAQLWAFKGYIVRSHVPFLYRRMIRRVQMQTKKACEELRGKDVIEVAFLLPVPGMWKLDYVFRQMMNNPHYHPYVVIIPFSKYRGFSQETLDGNLRKTEQFVREKEFEYVVPYDADKDEWIDVKKRWNPDIVFFTDPYRDVPSQYFVWHFRDKLTCYVPYGFSSLNLHALNYGIASVSLFSINFAETEMHRQFAQTYCGSKGVNFEVTGYPGTEVYLDKHYQPQNVWKAQTYPKKRVIWAPHHTIGESGEGISISTFLQYADSMLFLAQKYADTVQFAFKPHQILRFKLNALWGKEKTDSYYQKWADMDNTQLEETGYVDLFLGSDAMIHDCGGFTTEYLFVNKPVMYLVKSDNVQNQFHEFGQMSFAVHYYGKSVSDVESFIRTVVLQGNDSMLERRTEFYVKYLQPKDGLSPSQKIISCIESKIDSGFK